MTRPPSVCAAISCSRRRVQSLQLRYGAGGGDKQMRKWGCALLLVGAGCQQRAVPAAKAAEMTFDGAQVTDAAARVAQGERVSRVLGCRGCHRDNLQGGSF